MGGEMAPAGHLSKIIDTLCEGIFPTGKRPEVLGRTQTVIPKHRMIVRQGLDRRCPGDLAGVVDRKSIARPAIVDRLQGHETGNAAPIERDDGESFGVTHDLIIVVDPEPECGRGSSWRSKVAEAIAFRPEKDMDDRTRSRAVARDVIEIIDRFGNAFRATRKVTYRAVRPGIRIPDKSIVDRAPLTITCDPVRVAYVIG
jgi:hypothetical protein